MRFASFLIAGAALVGLVVAACADSANDTSGIAPDSGAPADGSALKDASSGSDSGPTCTKQTCETVEDACGDHDDGCGGKFSCGSCKAADACAPATCASLNKTCGSFDDTCGGTVSCGACATDTCPKDGKEPNNNQDSANDLGSASDYDNATTTVPTLQSSDGDEDWFKLKVVDGGFGGNPLITASVTDAQLEITVFHICNSKPDYSYCHGAGTQDNQVGHGCFALGTVALNTECKGIDESGTTYVRVRKRATDMTCHSYELTVKVE